MISLSGLEAGVYLRKSRAEDGLDTAETLSHHRKMLTDFAAREHVHVIETYAEVVSGESLAVRPEMLRLLDDVERGRYGCVLCMDLDRLSRGRMRDQGVILDTFRAAGTLIATPEKVYDLEEEVDEEYAELKTFLARREYKIINKRLQRGKVNAASSGCYVATAPFGYRKVSVNRCTTLEIYEPEAVYVRMLFEMYKNGTGCNTIAEQFNALGVHPRRAAAWTRVTIRKMLSNPAYIGQVLYGTQKWSRHDGKLKVTPQPREKWILTDGLHPPIIDRETFNQCQDILQGRYKPPSYDGTIVHPLTGLVRCAKCGKPMHHVISHGVSRLHCLKKGCCASSDYAKVEEALLSDLAAKLSALELGQCTAPPDDTPTAARLAAVQAELDAAQRSKAKLYELVEAAIYSPAEFRERMDVLRQKLSRLERQEQELQAALTPPAPAPDLIPKLRSLLEVYRTTPSRQRSALLREVVLSVTYSKEKGAAPSAFTLRVTLRT